MNSSDVFDAGHGRTDPGVTAPGGLLDVLNVAAVVLDANGHIVFWSPQAEELFGYTSDEALGRFAGRLLVHEEDLATVIELFTEVMEGSGSWSGVFPVLHKDGTTLLVEFRNMRLTDQQGAAYALGIASDRNVIRRLERNLALSARLVSQSPIGHAVLDTDLRYVTVNPALERIHGLSAERHTGRHIREIKPFQDMDAVESAMRSVLETGTPRLDDYVTGRDPAGDEGERAWSVSYHRLEDSAGKILGVVTTVVDVTERHRTATEAARARRRLAIVADASVRIGTTLDLGQTARELAEVSVPELADVAAVDVLDSVLDARRTPVEQLGGAAMFRALAVAAGHPSEAVTAADPPGETAKYEPDRLVTQCVGSGRPVLVARVTADDLQRIARDAAAAETLARAGVHSYLAVPLIARGEVLGALDLKRDRNPLPFTEDDVLMAGELATRAAVCIDNARWFQRERNTALTLQRSLLPAKPPQQRWMEVAYRYQPAQAAGEVGGDWFDVIPLPGDKTALVVGDVMGSGINAAAAMGQLRTATRTLAALELDPAQLLGHLDAIASELESSFATCVYAVHDPLRGECLVSTAGHLPPVLIRSGAAPRLLDLPTGAPLGVGGVRFDTTRFPLTPGDRLVLYTDGLVETRDEPIDSRLETLLSLLDDQSQPLETTCDVLLGSLREPGDHDDVALLIARIRSDALPVARPVRTAGGPM